jgi:flagellar L-ring protein FlgH
MARHRRFRRHSFAPLVASVVLLSLAGAQTLRAQLGFPKKSSKKSQVETSLEQYLTSVRGRAVAKEDQRTTGSLWFPAAPMPETAFDYKARHTGDLVIIRVVDNFSATSNGTGSQQRSFSASSGIGALFGNLRSTANVQNLFSPASTETLSGKGASTLASTVSLSLSGRVVEALPNGVLVVEAVRDLTVGNDRQTIVLHGLVRPGDIAADGSVLSTAVSNLQAEIRGRGLVADSIRQPNIVIRTLLKILNF